ncbi:MAG: glycoside hydrolase [Deltaproteobacteria bacterium]|nr:glycoside hydrolase [Deltaproteobacteria bacterium]MCB9489831.1 glycoside hydrolase [Deltaproteobacteria bacterium]
MASFARKELGGPWQLAPVASFAGPGGYGDVAWLSQEIPAHWQEHPELTTHVGKVAYRKTFDFKRARGKRTRLVLPGVFYYCTTYLNGTRLGDHEGFFEPQVYDVTDLLASSNELILEVECPDEEDKNRKRMVTGVFSHWDCLDPATNPGGIWRTPYLQDSGGAYVSENLIHTERLSDEGAHQVERLFIQAVEGGEVRVTTTYTPETFDGKAQKFVNEFEIRPGLNSVKMRHVVADPHLWWTHDLTAFGRPDLYRVTVVITQGRRTLDEWSDLIGLRTLEWNEYQLRLNGRRVWIKGSNLPPMDTRVARSNPETAAKDMELTRAAHLNMQRVHAHVGAPCLYEAADRAGVLLWQDMPLQWSYRKEAQDTVRRQAEAMVRLLYNRPSVAAWCCHNESFFVFDTAEESPRVLAKTVFTLAIWSWNRDVMDTGTKAAVGMIDPMRLVVRSSGEIPFLREGTDFHFYGGWYRIMGTMRAFDRICRRGGGHPKALRFITEFGAQSFPNLENATKFMDADIEKIDWKHLEARHSLQPALMEHWTPRAGHDLASYIQATQDYQSRLNRHYIDRLRRLKYRPNGGAISFMFLDPNPAILWSVVDYWRTPKSSFAKLADAFRPVYAFAILDKDRYRKGETAPVRVYAVNDERRPIPDARVHVRITDDENRPLIDETVPQALPPDSYAVLLAEYGVQAHVAGRLRVELTLLHSDESFENVYEAEIV